VPGQEERRVGAHFEVAPQGLNPSEGRSGLNSYADHVSPRGPFSNWDSAHTTAYKVAGQLTLEERHALFQLHAAGTAVGATADRLGRHRSTIYREVGRNRKADGSYLPETAAQMSARLATQDQAGRELATGFASKDL
jgi:hypothetical protein